jgi:anti-sigma factor RsiW
MRCDRVQEWLGAYRDGELSASEREVVSAHLATCQTCSAILADDARIGLSLKRQSRSLARPALARRISGALDRVDRERADAAPTRALLAGFRSFRAGDLARQAAALAAAAIIGALSTWWMLDMRVAEGRTERDIVNAHIRSLLQDSPVQVASSDQHTVQPWFAGRTDFAPEVKDLAAEGFPLLGGRLDYVADRRVGVVVYMRRLHVINVFMWPAGTATSSAPQAALRNGYNMLGWTRNGVSYRAVSDLSVDELRTLIQRL